MNPHASHSLNARHGRPQELSDKNGKLNAALEELNHFKESSQGKELQLKGEMLDNRIKVSEYEDELARLRPRVARSDAQVRIPVTSLNPQPSTLNPKLGPG